MSKGMSIFTLFGSILVDSDEAQKSISKTEKSAEGLGSKLGAGITTAAKWGVAVGAGAAAAGTALFAMATKASESTDRIDKMSQQLNMSREGFQEWDFILSQNGVSIESMKTGMKSMTTAMSSLADEGKKGEETLGKLGITLDDLNNKSQEEIFEQAVIELQKMPEGFEKARLAQQLFGKQGQEMLPMLNASKGSIEELKNKAHELGLVLSDDAVDSGVKLADTMDQLKRSFGSVVTQVGVAVMPIIQKFAEWVIEHMPTIQKVFGEVFGVIQTAVEIVVDIFTTYMLPILKDYFNWIQSNMPTIQATAEKVFGMIKEVAKEVWTFFEENLIPIFKAVFKFVEDNFPTIQRIFESVFGIAKDVVIILWDVFKGLWEFVEPTFPLIGTVIQNAFDIITGVVEGVTKTFEVLVGWIKSAVEWLNVFDKTKATDTGSFGGIGSDLKKYTNGSLAGGISYVPFDGYKAELHKGERVLTAEENAKSNQGSQISQVIVQQMVVREEADIKKIARELHKLEQQSSRFREVLV